MSVSEEPPKKKRKLNDDEEDWMPDEIGEEDINENDEPTSDLEKENIKTPAKKSPKKINETKEESDADEDGDISRTISFESTNWYSDKKEKIKITLSDSTYLKLQKNKQIINRLNAKELKEILNEIRSLKTIDGMSPFEGIRLTGKKDEILSNVSILVSKIFCGEKILNSHKFKKAPFDKWCNDITKFIKTFELNKKTKSNKIDKVLSSKLNACNKDQIVSMMEIFLNKHPEYCDEIKELIPKPNLQKLYDEHNKLINAISKSMPWAKYGSNRDNYAFKRCKSAINTAKRKIISDGNEIIKSQDWDSVLEYLIVCKDYPDRFPEWDDNCNNAPVRDLKKKLENMFKKVKKNLGNKLNDIQKERVKELNNSFKD